MDSEMKIFEHPDFGEVRTLQIDDEPWFVGKDVAEMLGYKDTSDALKNHVDIDDKLSRRFTDSGQSRSMYIINESGLYSLILSSKLPASKKFKRWVTREVIPSIRKHGAYLTPNKIEEIILNPDAAIEMLNALKQEREKNAKLTATNSALEMKANTWNDRSVLNALIRSYAKRRCGNNFVLAWNMFYKELRYSEHIDPKLRQAHTPKNHILDHLTDEEIKIAVKQAVAWCEQMGIDTGKVINEVNRNNVSIEA